MDPEDGLVPLSWVWVDDAWTVGTPVGMEGGRSFDLWYVVGFDLPVPVQAVGPLLKPPAPPAETATPPV